MTSRKQPSAAFWIIVAPVVAVVGHPLSSDPGFTATKVLRAEEPEQPSLSPVIRRALAWLPEDTETVIAAQSFTITVPDPNAAELPPERSKEAFNAAIPIVALGALAEEEMAKYLKPLVARKVVLALRGARNYEWVTASLPAYRMEGCLIMIFEKDLGEAGKAWEKMLRAGADEVRRMAGRDVFVHPPTKAMRPARPWNWPGKLGVYLTMLNADTILCATSDKYLEEVLERIDMPPTRRALPDTLPEWKHVNSMAPVWILRHNSDPGERARVIEGVTWTLANDRFQAVYVPVAGEEAKAVAAVRGRWQNEALAVRPTIERQKDDTVVVSSTTENLASDVLFMYALNVYWLEADSGEDTKD
jgi:hypothetical protein